MKVNIQDERRKIKEEFLRLNEAYQRMKKCDKHIYVEDIINVNNKPVTIEKCFKCGLRRGYTLYNTGELAEDFMPFIYGETTGEDIRSNIYSLEGFNNIPYYASLDTLSKYRNFNSLNILNFCFDGDEKVLNFVNRLNNKIKDKTFLSRLVAEIKLAIQENSNYKITEDVFHFSHKGKLFIISITDNSVFFNSVYAKGDYIYNLNGSYIEEDKDINISYNNKLNGPVNFNYSIKQVFDKNLHEKKLTYQVKDKELETLQEYALPNNLVLEINEGMNTKKFGFDNQGESYALIKENKSNNSHNLSVYTDKVLMVIDKNLALDYVNGVITNEDLLKLITESNYVRENIR